MKKKPSRFELELQFNTAQRALPDPARWDLLAWLRRRRKATGNGYPHRDFWYISPTGERRRL